jgi:plasmid stabilization system protein ParE
MASKNELKVRYSERAKNEYLKILEDLNKDFGIRVAEKVDKRIQKILAQIVINPNQFPESKERKNIRRCVLSKQTTLYYKHNNDYIEVVTFWANQKNPKQKRLK